MKSQGKPRSSLQVEAFSPSPSAKIDTPRTSSAQGVPEGRTAGEKKGPFRRIKKGEAETGVKEVKGPPQGGLPIKEAVKDTYSPFRFFLTAQPHEMGAGKPEGGGKGTPFPEGAAEEDRRNAEGAAPCSTKGKRGIKVSSLHLAIDNFAVLPRQGVKKRRGQRSPPGISDLHFMTSEVSSVFLQPGSC